MTSVIMSDMENLGQKNKSRDFITKEFFILFSPFLASYLWNIFYEAGYAQFFGIPSSLIRLDAVNVLVTNRLTLTAATLAFLWIGLYYNLLPSISSPLFRGIITLLLILAVSLGFVVGRANARNMAEFLVTKHDGQELVVLRVYGDNIVTSAFDRNGHKLIRSFHIFKVGGKEALALNLEQIGPLEIN